MVEFIYLSGIWSSQHGFSYFTLNLFYKFSDWLTSCCCVYRSHADTCSYHFKICNGYESKPITFIIAIDKFRRYLDSFYNVICCVNIWGKFQFSCQRSVVFSGCSGFLRYPKTYWYYSLICENILTGVICHCSILYSNTFEMDNDDFILNSLFWNLDSRSWL